MSEERKDRRVQRTQRALLDALIALIAEKGYEHTTVQDVLDRADVGRSTFYAHYFNKSDLLFRGFSLFRLDVDAAMAADGTVRTPDVTFIFVHAAEQHTLYPGLRGTEALDRMMAIARADLCDSFRKLLAKRTAASDESEGRTEFRVQFLTGALLHLLFWWLDADMPETPETMNLWFSQLGNRAINENT